MAFAKAPPRWMVRTRTGSATGETTPTMVVLPEYECWRLLQSSWQRLADSPPKIDAGLQGVLPVNYRQRLRRTLVSRASRPAERRRNLARHEPSRAVDTGRWCARSTHVRSRGLSVQVVIWAAGYDGALRSPDAADAIAG